LYLPTKLLFTHFSRMKRILLTPTKNEAHILPSFIAYHQNFFDNIIIADQFSADDTWEIANSYQSVIAIRNRGEFDEINRRQILIDAAKALDDSPLIFGLDADEFLIASSTAWKQFCYRSHSDPLQKNYSFSWVHILPSLESAHTVKSIFCRNGFTGSFGISPIHAPRVPLEDHTEHVEEISILHLNMMWPKRHRMKVWWYACIEAEIHRYIGVDIRRALFKYGSSQLFAEHLITDDEKHLYRGILDNINLKDSWETWHKAEIIKKLLTPKLANKLRHAPIWDYPWSHELSCDDEAGRMRQAFLSYLLDEWVFKTRLYARSPAVRFVDAILRRIPNLN
jgi:glycosyltransferase involved in cell wall biosynthesis